MSRNQDQERIAVSSEHCGTCCRDDLMACCLEGATTCETSAEIWFDCLLSARRKLADPHSAQIET